MSKKNQADSIGEFYEALYGFRNDQYVEFRSRTSNKEEAWQKVDSEHEWSQAENNYRITEAPMLVLSGRYIECPAEGERLTVQSAKELYGTLKKLYRAGKGEYLDAGDDGNPTGWDVGVQASGLVRIGCQQFEWTEIQDYAKKFGLTK